VRHTLGFNEQLRGQTRAIVTSTRAARGHRVTRPERIADTSCGRATYTRRSIRRLSAVPRSARPPAASISASSLPSSFHLRANVASLPRVLAHDAGGFARGEFRTGVPQMD